MQFSEYVKNKRIAVVGPAHSTNGTNQGDSIDSYDIVMRFNCALPIHQESKVDIGTRTDILCNCLDEQDICGGRHNPKLWKSCGASWLLSPYPSDCWFSKTNVANFIKRNNGLLNFECFDSAYYKELSEDLGTRPNTGLLGILHLLKFEIAELYITGITFGTGGYRQGYKPNINSEQYNKLANSSIHQQAPQLELFKKIYKESSVIKTDQTLLDIVNGDQ